MHQLCVDRRPYKPVNFRPETGFLTGGHNEDTCMASFPKREAEILALALALKRGLQTNMPLFPFPPVSVPNLDSRRATYLMRQDTALAAAAAAEAATTAKDEALEALADAMKADLRYAENTVNFDDDKLKLIGWSGRKAAASLTPPGQPRLLEAPRQGEGWVFLDWKPPADGGRSAAYTIERRERPAGSWQTVATAIETEATLVDQTRGAELEYRIIAVNKAGAGPESNTVMAVL